MRRAYLGCGEGVAVRQAKLREEEDDWVNAPRDDGEEAGGRDEPAHMGFTGRDQYVSAKIKTRQQKQKGLRMTDD
jgi:hypothetical protein